jgi:hypothetical protein
MVLPRVRDCTQPAFVWLLDHKYFEQTGPRVPCLTSAYVNTKTQELLQDSPWEGQVARQDLQQLLPCNALMLTSTCDQTYCQAPSHLVQPLTRLGYCCHDCSFRVRSKGCLRLQLGKAHPEAIKEPIATAALPNRASRLLSCRSDLSALAWQTNTARSATRPASHRKVQHIDSLTLGLFYHVAV